ncbi:AraC family transcriptional regulator [Candidatus Mcinerneyibacteriota bacterium]|nr:AraC family transcriptional regulator [Candidatus Mcinerneyibacteriota bacterium]
MDYSDMIERSLLFIEENLSLTLSYKDVAREAGCSPYHFHRIFHGLTGMTADMYIRGRRLTTAAEKIVGTSESILSIALDVGYDSHEAFTRAFKKQFESSPSMVRKRGVVPLSGRVARMETGPGIPEKGGQKMMEPKIVYMEPFKVVGIEKETTLKNNTIPQMWADFNPRAREVSHQKTPSVCYGICEYKDLDEFTDETPFNVLVSVEVTEFDHIPHGMVSREMPAQKYAVFTHKGPVATLGETYDEIYKRWFPRSDFVFAEKDDFERYDHRFRHDDPEHSELDIYIPVE